MNKFLHRSFAAAVCGLPKCQKCQKWIATQWIPSRYYTEGTNFIMYTTQITYFTFSTELSLLILFLCVVVVSSLLGCDNCFFYYDLKILNIKKTMVPQLPKVIDSTDIANSVQCSKHVKNKTYPNKISKWMRVSFGWIPLRFGISFCPLHTSVCPQECRNTDSKWKFKCTENSKNVKLR